MTKSKDAVTGAQALGDWLMLADRCEKSAGPDRELDALIWCALRGVKYKSHNPVYAGMGEREGLETQVEYTVPPKRTRMVSNGPVPHAKPVTASLDAAMTLVPEGVSVDVGRTQTGKRAYSTLCRLSDPSSREPSPMWKAGAATMALALCAASLRARAGSWPRI